MPPAAPVTSAVFPLRLNSWSRIGAAGRTCDGGLVMALPSISSAGDHQCARIGKRALDFARPAYKPSVPVSQGTTRPPLGLAWFRLVEGSRAGVLEDVEAP